MWLAVRPLRPDLSLISLPLIWPRIFLQDLQQCFGLDASHPPRP